MNKQTEALKLALEALEFNCVMSEDGEDLTPMKIKKAITAIHEVLVTQRTWVGLTDEERRQHNEEWDSDVGNFEFDAIEAKLKEKNT